MASQQTAEVQATEDEFLGQAVVRSMPTGEVKLVGSTGEATLPLQSAHDISQQKCGVGSGTYGCVIDEDGSGYGLFCGTTSGSGVGLGSTTGDCYGSSVKWR
jgi:hypothetical protein